MRSNWRKPLKSAARVDVARDGCWKETELGLNRRTVVSGVPGEYLIDSTRETNV